MLVEELSTLADVIARCMVMRLLDQEEAKLGSTSVLLRRERWRQERENRALDDMQRRALKCEAKIHKMCSWGPGTSLSALTRDTAMEASAMIVGAVNQQSLLQQQPSGALSCRTLCSTEDHPSLQAAKRLEKNGKAYREAVESQLAQRRNELDSAESSDTSIRSLLLRESCTVRTFVWCWQHDVVVRKRSSHAEAVKALISPLLQYVQSARDAFSAARSGALDDDLHVGEGERGWTNGTVSANHIMMNSSSKRKAAGLAPPFEWTASHAQKWRAAARLVVRMQARARGSRVRRTVRPLLLRNRAKQEQDRRQWQSSVLLPTASRYLQQTNGALQRYMQLAHFIASEEPRLQDYYDNEEGRFQQQWNRYVKQLTQFYLHECPLDMDWRAQRSNPNDEASPIVFLNVRTAKVQSENPNMLKVVAAKNRQWLKATREREQRAALMRDATVFLNNAKERLREAEDEMSKSPFFI